MSDSDGHPPVMVELLNLSVKVMFMICRKGGPDVVEEKIAISCFGTYHSIILTEMLKLNPEFRS